jgi:hypothetical protein
MASFKDFSNVDDSEFENESPPPSKFIDWLHGQASTKEPTDLHHPLGTTPESASPGNHNHDGKNSFALWDVDDVPVDITSTATGTQLETAINGILALLREKSS